MNGKELSVICEETKFCVGKKETDTKSSIDSSSETLEIQHDAYDPRHFTASFSHLRNSTGKSR